MKGVNRKYVLIGIIAVLVVGFIVLSFKLGFFGPRGSQGSEQCDASPGEWVPQQGECQGNQELQNKCNEFCSSHPDCCPGWNEGDYTSSQGGPGQTLLPLPSESEIASLTRNYVNTIKAIDEGPNIYSRTTASEVISDEVLDKMKDTGFNTVQIMLIGKWSGDKIVFDDVNNAVLLNDIVAIKKKGLAVWVAISLGGVSQQKIVLGETYEKLKTGYMNLVDLSSVLMEKYKVEYLTVNNEADMFFLLQTNWGTESQINNYLIDFYPAMNELARENFHGKLINKMTLPAKRTNEFLSATFEKVDIAGVDVGPAMDNIPLTEYKAKFNDYQFYATKANAAGVPWMNAEYWQKDFDNEASQFVKENELTYASASFDAYLAVTPKGAGYTWNEMSMFSLQPDGEATRLTMKEFLAKI